MFEIQQKTKVKVKVYGNEFEMAKPTVGQVEKLQSLSNTEGKSDGQKFEMICDFLAILGMPKEFTMQMEVDHLLKLISYLSGELDLDKKKEEKAGP